MFSKSLAMNSSFIGIDTRRKNSCSCWRVRIIDLYYFCFFSTIVESLPRKGRLISRGKRAALDCRGEGNGTIALAKTRDSITSKTWGRKGPSSWSQINSSFAVMVPQGGGISISFFLPSPEYLTIFIEAGNRSRLYTRLN